MKGMHKESHGLVPNKIIEVHQDVVAAFLGRTGDPEDAEVTDTGLKVFSENRFSDHPGNRFKRSGIVTT